MPYLNLLKILSGDNISSQVEKVNFNFEQIKLNGGGPIGGDGPAGPAGPPGGTGPAGPAGNDGLNGERWYVEGILGSAPTIGTDYNTGPIDGDWLLVTTTSSIYQAIGGIWVYQEAFGSASEFFKRGVGANNESVINKNALDKFLLTEEADTFTGETIYVGRNTGNYKLKLVSSGLHMQLAHLIDAQADPNLTVDIKINKVSTDSIFMMGNNNKDIDTLFRFKNFNADVNTVRIHDYNTNSFSAPSSDHEYVIIGGNQNSFGGGARSVLLGGMLTIINGDNPYSTFSSNYDSGFTTSSFGVYISNNSSQVANSDQIVALSTNGADANNSGKSAMLISDYVSLSNATFAIIFASTISGIYTSSNSVVMGSYDGHVNGSTFGIVSNSTSGNVINSSYGTVLGIQNGGVYYSAFCTIIGSSSSSIGNGAGQYATYCVIIGGHDNIIEDGPANVAIVGGESHSVKKYTPTANIFKNCAIIGGVNNKFDDWYGGSQILTEDFMNTVIIGSHDITPKYANSAYVGNLVIKEDHDIITGDDPIGWNDVSSSIRLGYNNAPLLSNSGTAAGLIRLNKSMVKYKRIGKTIHLNFYLEVYMDSLGISAQNKYLNIAMLFNNYDFLSFYSLGGLIPEPDPSNEVTVDITAKSTGSKTYTAFSNTYFVHTGIAKTDGPNHYAGPVVQIHEEDPTYGDQQIASFTAPQRIYQLQTASVPKWQSPDYLNSAVALSKRQCHVLNAKMQFRNMHRPEDFPAITPTNQLCISFYTPSALQYYLVNGNYQASNGNQLSYPTIDTSGSGTLNTMTIFEGSMIYEEKHTAITGDQPVYV